jgi:hypothetical protein
MSTISVSSVMDDLQRQHLWVEEQKKRGDDAFSLVSPDAFMRGIRDLGYRSTLTALDELIDNAVQSNAQSVWVFPAYYTENKSKKKPDAIVVVDDGHGMEPDMIRIAVRWGGTHRENDRTGLGRYGFGLPSSCVSIGQRYTVYSKIEGGEWHAVTIDVRRVSKAISEHKKIDAEAVKQQPPSFIDDHVDIANLKAGTIIVIDELDRLDSGFKTTQTFVRKLTEHVGVQYRKMMSQVKFIIDKTEAQAVDPLFLDETARWFEETPVRAQSVTPIQFELQGAGGEVGTVRIRAAAFPFNFHLKDPDGDVRPSNHNNRYHVMRDFNGILVCRAGRQIDVVTRVPWTTFINYDRFWGIEIDFDPALDEYFGITTNKQQIVFSESLLDHLKTHGLPALIKDLRVRLRDSKSKILASLGKRDKTARASEKTMPNIKKRKTRKVSPSSDQVKKAESNLTQQAKAQADVTGESLEAAKERVEKEATERPYKIDFESVVEAPAYRPERLGPQYLLRVNTSHRFFSDIYEPAGRVPGLRSRLEALLFVLGEAELDAVGEREKFYKTERVLGSQRLTEALADLDEVGDVVDEASADMEDQETLGVVGP